MLVGYAGWRAKSGVTPRVQSRLASLRAVKGVPDLVEDICASCCRLDVERA